MNQKPTKEQEQEFWEWYGLRFSIFGSLPCCVTASNLIVGAEFPPIDLNNLFKYAVPKIQLLHLETARFSMNEPMLYKWIAFGDKHSSDTKFMEDPALALFWALWQVKEVSK